MIKVDGGQSKAGTLGKALFDLRQKCRRIGDIDVDGAVIETELHGYILDGWRLVSTFRAVLPRGMRL